jgi:hypothetical protein
LSDYFPYPLEELDWLELAKYVTYKKVLKGEQIKGDKNFRGTEVSKEIYIILKGKVRLAFPMADSECPEFKTIQIV